MRKGTVRANGKKVQALRELKGWNQATLAQAAGVESPKTIAHLEAGKPVLFRTLRAVAGALDVEVRDVARGRAVRSMASSAGLTRRPSDLVPLAPELFVGREEALREIKRRLGVPQGRTCNAAIRVALHGWPGVGKSTMIAAVANDAEVAKAYPDGILWASLGQEPALLSELVSWSRVLGSNELLSVTGLKEANAHLNRLLHGKRVLLLLDDVWDIHHAEVFRVGAPCATLVSSRIPSVAESLSSPGDAYRLDVLSDAKAGELLQLLAPEVVAKFPAECAELIRELQGLPLALQVAGRLLRIESKRGWDVRDLVRELREDAARILEAKAPADMVDLAQETTPTVAALLRKSTACLDPESRGHFASLGAFVPKPGKFGLEAVAAVWGMSKTDAKRIVDELIDRGLLEPIGQGRFWVHALLAKHARTLCED